MYIYMYMVIIYLKFLFIIYFDVQIFKDNIVYFNEIIYVVYDLNYYFIVCEYWFRVLVDCFLF